MNMRNDQLHRYQFSLSQAAANNPRNAAKGCLFKYSLVELKQQYDKENVELDDALFSGNMDHIRAEGGDVGNLLPALIYKADLDARGIKCEGKCSHCTVTKELLY